MKNGFFEAIRANKRPLQAWMWNPSILTAEIMARSGFDSVCLDLQHGAANFSDVYPIAALLSAHGVTPMVRIPLESDLGWVSRVLDAGIYGVICPDVKSPESAQAFASACKYAPAGARGFGPVRPSLAALSGYNVVAAGFDTAVENREVMAIVQIESPQGLECVREIMAVPGVDGVFPGMVDFGLLAHGKVIVDFSDPRIRKPLETIIEAAHGAGKPVGLPAISLDSLPLLVELGADWIQVGNDVAWLTAAAKQTVSTARAAVENAKPGLA